MRGYSLTLAVLLISIVLMGTVYAADPMPATLTWSAEFEVSTTATDVDTTIGGNITFLNLSASSQTSRWAGYTGNLSGGLVLSDGSDIFFRWTSTVTEGSIVCASLNSSHDWDNDWYESRISHFDVVWNRTQGSDEGNQTFTDTQPFSFTWNGDGITDINSSDTGPDQAGDDFLTGVISGNSTTDSDTQYYMFCTVVNTTGAVDYKGDSANNYELLVPTYCPADGVEDNTWTNYYFYAQID